MGQLKFIFLIISFRGSGARGPFCCKSTPRIRDGQRLHNALRRRCDRVFANPQRFCGVEKQPVGITSADVSSLVPAPLASVIRRPILRFVSAPTNSGLPANTVRSGVDVEENPVGETTRDGQLPDAGGGPVGHPMTINAARIVAFERRTSTENREAGREPEGKKLRPNSPPELAPATASSQVPSVTQRSGLPLAS
jgi:hypothetical protein